MRRAICESYVRKKEWFKGSLFYGYHQMNYICLLSAKMDGI